MFLFLYFCHNILLFFVLLLFHTCIILCFQLSLPDLLMLLKFSDHNSCFCSRRIDRTYKMYYGGAQQRPDAPYSRPIVNPSGKVIGHVGEGNRKDIRNAVEAAHKAAPGYVICHHLKSKDHSSKCSRKDERLAAGARDFAFVFAVKVLSFFYDCHRVLRLSLLFENSELL